MGEGGRGGGGEGVTQPGDHHDWVFVIRDRGT